MGLGRQNVTGKKSVLFLRPTCWNKLPRYMWAKEHLLNVKHSSVLRFGNGYMLAYNITDPRSALL